VPSAVTGPASYCSCLRRHAFKSSPRRATRSNIGPFERRTRARTFIHPRPSARRKPGLKLCQYQKARHGDMLYERPHRPSPRPTLVCHEQKAGLGPGARCKTLTRLTRPTRKQATAVTQPPERANAGQRCRAAAGNRQLIVQPERAYNVKLSGATRSVCSTSPNAPIIRPNRSGAG